MRYLLLLAPIALLSLVSHGQSSENKEAVLKVVLAFQEDFNDGSFKNASTYSTSDWEHIAPSGAITKGRDSILKSVRAIHQTFLKGVTMRTESMNVRFITSDVAVVDAIHKIDNYTTPDGVRHENERQIKTYVIVKKDGKWLLTQDQNTIIH